MNLIDNVWYWDKRTGVIWFRYVKKYTCNVIAENQNESHYHFALSFLLEYLKYHIPLLLKLVEHGLWLQNPFTTSAHLGFGNEQASYFIIICTAI